MFMKIWIKTIKTEKITNSLVVDYDSKKDNLLEILRDVCYSFDIPTPLFRQCHQAHFNRFLTVRFNKDDFMEEVDFDYLLIENGTDNKKKDKRK